MIKEYKRKPWPYMSYNKELIINGQGSKEIIN